MSPETLTFRIGAHDVGARQPLFVIAEIGLNHGGSVERALALVDGAAAAGVSAVKLQTVIAEDFIAPTGPRDVFAPFQLDEAAHRAVAERARRHGMAFISTPLSLSAVDLLERVGVDAYKIASGDLTFTRLISRCASTGAPVIVSTGMGTVPEARHAVEAARAAGAAGVGVLHCVSAYPVPPGAENLRGIATLAAALDVPVGLSDHGSDTFAVPIAVAFGASLYERHIVLAHDDGSIDAAVSSTPEEFAALIAAAERAAASLGSGLKECAAAEEASRSSRRSLYAARALQAGHVVADADLIAMRPSGPLAPDDAPRLVGLRLTRDVARGDALAPADFEGYGRRG